MDTETITDKERAMAQRCAKCPLCRYARRKQRGIIFGIVKRMGSSVCPYCRAYEKVHGRKPHASMPAQKQC